MAASTERNAGTVPPAPAGSVEEALERVLPSITPLPAETIPLTKAVGRVLAEDVIAPADLWPLPRAAMDGYAVRSSDVALASPEHRVVLDIMGTALAGFSTRTPVPPGTTVQIATGAPMPEGADAVIPVEEVHVKDQRLVVDVAVPAAKHVFPAGEDARCGETILRSGTVLHGGHLGLLAGLGITSVAAVRRARVAILAVGDELVEPGRGAAPGQVRESNSYALGAEIEALGAEPVRLGIAGDDAEALVVRIRAGLRTDALIVCAGMSVGERDVVKDALVRAGVHLVFWRVPMKPGFPAAFGLAGDTVVFGLPGNPAAAIMAYEELVRPALRAMMGYRQVHPMWLPARLLAPVKVRPGRRRYLWARAAVAPDGLVVEPLRVQSTATLRSISDANALIRIEPEISTLAAGDRVQIRFRADPESNDTLAHRTPVLAVVGAKSAGKTTLIEGLLPELRRRGYRVAVIKHDAHGFEIDQKGTDTWRFARAGAATVGIAGPGKAAAIWHDDGAKSLVEMEALVRGVDLVLVEGYSREAVPMIEVRRSGVISDKPAPAGPVLAVVGDRAGDGINLTFAGIPALVDLIESELLPAAGRPRSQDFSAPSRAR